MIDDIGADEYKIEENEREYILRISSTDNKINLNLSTNNKKQFKNYSGEFTLDDLQRINRVFLLTHSIYDAKEEFKKAIERKKIAISERDDYIHIVFYMMIGTDTSTLSVALPRDETPRIIRLEQNLNILKLGKDNISERLAVFEREADEIKKDLDKIQFGNNTLNQIADTIGQGIPDVSEILREYNANRNNPNYTSHKAKGEDGLDQPYSSTGFNQKGDIEQPYSSAQYNNKNEDVTYSSARFNNDNNREQNYTSTNYNDVGEDGPYTSTKINNNNNEKGEDGPYTSTNIRRNPMEPIGEVNRESSIQNDNENDNNNSKDDIIDGPYVSNQKQEQDQDQDQDQDQGEIFPNGIINNIIKRPEEIDFVTNYIESKFQTCSYALLYKGSRDGDTAADFHTRCDEAEKTLVIVEDNYGNRFGGFTTQDWGGQYIQKKDEDAFLFSIDKNKIYDIIPDQNAIGCFPNFGPVFFGCQIRIYDNYLEKGGTTYKKGLNYRTTEDFELTNGKQTFGVKDIEVYEVKVNS